MMSKTTIIFLLTSILALTGEAINQTKLEKKDSSAICALTGLCQGTLIKGYDNLSKDECLYRCDDDKSCNWWSFSKTESRCQTYEDCPELDENYLNYVSGQDDCFNGCVCQTIVITLKNGALAQSSRQGIYQRAEIVNGKTSWISPNNINAIWFDTDKFGTIYDDWIIGSLGKLGGNFGGIASTGNQGMSSCPYNVSMDAWKYLSNSHQWIIADANDVSIECLTKGLRAHSQS